MRQAAKGMVATKGVENHQAGSEGKTPAKKRGFNRTIGTGKGLRQQGVLRRTENEVAAIGQDENVME